MGRVKDYFHEEILRQQEADQDDRAEEYINRINQGGPVHNDDILIAALSQSINDAKRRLYDANIARIRIDIEIMGGTSDGAVSCTFKVGEHYDQANAEASRLSEAVTEFMRRKGWREKHPVLMIEDRTQIEAVPEPTEKLVGDERPRPDNPDDPVF